MPRYIRYYENEEWKYASVKDIGDISQLKTIVKTDVVSAINSLIDNGLAEELQGILNEQIKQAEIIKSAQDLIDILDRDVKSLSVTGKELQDKFTSMQNELSEKVNVEEYEEEYKNITDALIRKADLTEFQNLGKDVDELNVSIGEVNGVLEQKVSRTTYDNDLGLNKWVASKYEVEESFENTPPSFSLIKGVDAKGVVEFLDDSSVVAFTGDNVISHYFTNISMKEKKTVYLNVTHKDGLSIYMNGAVIYKNGQSNSAGSQVALGFNMGWNTVDILHGNKSGVPSMNLGVKLSAQVDKLTAVIGIGNKNDSRLREVETSIKQTEDSIELMAKKDEVTSLGNKIASQESSISILSDAIETKVGSETFDAYSKRLETTESSVSVLQDSIVSKVEKKDFDELNGKYSVHQTAIEQMDEEIKLKASSESVNSVIGRVTATESQISVANDKISQNVSQLTDLSDKATAMELETGKIKQSVTDLSKTVTSQGATIAEHSSSITSLKDSIVLKAEAKSVYTKTEADEKTKKVVDDAKAEIKITTNGITQSVTDVQGVVDGVKKTVESQGTQIKQTSEDIALNVVKKGSILASINASQEGVKILGKHVDITGQVTFSSLDSSMQGKVNAGTQAKDKIDNMTIGGSNFLLNSNFIDGSYSPYRAMGSTLNIEDVSDIVGFSKCVKVTPSDNTQDSWIYIDLEVIPGIYTLSAFFKDGTGRSAIGVRDGSDSTGLTYNIIQPTKPSTGGWYRGVINVEFKTKYARLYFGSKKGVELGTCYVTGLQLERGSKESDWKISQKDVDKLIENVDKKAQDVTNKVSDMSNDNKATPVEKQQLKKEWATISSEKPQYEALATTYGITTEKTSYVNAYNTLNTVISPIISDTTVTSDISGATFRSAFNDYYDKKTQLIKKINETSRTLANTANTTINTNKDTWDRASNINSNGTFNSSKLSGQILDTQISSAIDWNGAKSLLDSWKSGTTLINGGMIATNSIFAQQIAIGDFTNLSQINEEKNPNNNTVATVNNKKYFKVGQSAYASITVLDNTYVEFKVGDEYYIAYSGYKDTGVSNINAIMRYYYSDGTNVNAGVVSVTSTGADTRISANLKITTAVDETKTLTAVKLILQKDSGSTGYFYVRDIEIRKRYTGELIVDGSIKSKQIDVSDLFANNAFITNLKAQKFSASQISGGVITGVTFKSTGSVGTVQISGSEILSSGKVEADTHEMRMDNGSLLISNKTKDYHAFLKGGYLSFDNGDNHAQLKCWDSGTTKQFQIDTIGDMGISSDGELRIAGSVTKFYGGVNIVSGDKVNTNVFLSFPQTSSVYHDSYGNLIAKPTASIGALFKVKDADTSDRLVVPIGKGTTGAIQLRGAYGGIDFYWQGFKSHQFWGDSANRIIRFGDTGGIFKWNNGAQRFECKGYDDGATNWAHLAGVWDTVSSREYKKDIEDFTDSALDIINASTPKQYRYNSQREEDRLNIGLIAEEAPYLIRDKEGKTVDSYGMTTLAWKAIQELSEQVRYLKNQLKNR